MRLVAGRSGQRRDPLLRRRRPRHRRGDAAQDRATAAPRGLPARVRRRHRRHRVPAPVDRVLHRGARASVDAARLREHEFKVVLDYSYGAASIVMPTVLAKLGADVLAVNPFASTAAATTIEDRRRAASRGSASWCARRERPRHRHRPRRRDRRPSSTTTAHVLDPAPGAARARHASSAEATAGRARSRCRSSRQPRGGAHRGATTAPRSCGPRLADASLMEVASSEPGGLRRARQEGGFIWPDFLPAYDATATLAKLLDLLAVTGRSLSAVVASAAARPHRPRDGADALGAQGRGDARAGRARAGRGVAACSSTASRCSAPGRLGAGAARPRGAGDARLGRGRQRRRGPPAGRRSTPGAIRQVAALTRATARYDPGRWTIPRSLQVLGGARVGRRRRRPGAGRDHRLRPGRARRRRVRAAARRRARPSWPTRRCAEVESTKSVSDVYAPVSGTHRSRSTPRSTTTPEQVNSDPYGDGLDLRGAR